MGLEPAKPEEKPAEPSAQTDEPPQPTIEPVDRATPPFVLLAVVMAITLTVIFFAATTTAASDASVRPYAISLAVGAGVILLLFGLVDVDRTAKGLLVSTLSVLPNLHAWGSQTLRRAILLASALILVAAGSVWIGPQGVISQTVKCDDAVEIEFSIRKGRQSCDGAISRDIWLLPTERGMPIGLSCFDSKLNRWEGTYNDNVASFCGARPQNANFVSDGIKLPDHDLLSTIGKRLTAGHDRLREALSNGVLPDRKVNDRLLLATWNLRDFGGSRFGYGDRMDEAYVYIAEVISHFDIVAIQELTNRAALSKLLGLLGPDYRAEFSFEAPGPGGNRERLGFVYDSRKVSFGDLSTTIVFEGAPNESSRTGQPARPPFLAEFVIDERRFFVVTAHAYYGQATGPRFEKRLVELDQMTSGINRTFQRNFPDQPVIFAGDMNVSSPNGREMETLLKNGFEAPAEMREQPTDINNRRPYDQILIWSVNAKKMPIGRFGVFKPTDFVFRLEDWNEYSIDMQRMIGADRRESTSLEELFERFRTFQISDHHLRWAEFRVDW